MIPPPRYSRFPEALLGWALVSVFFLGLQKFNPIFLNGFFPLSRAQWLGLDVLFLAGTALLVWGMKAMPPGDPADDIGRIPARVLLFGILGLAAFMRLYGVGTPLGQFPANYWDDLSLPLLDAFQILDYHHFIDYGYIEPGEPLYAYCLALAMYLFPKLSGILAERLVSAAFDLTAVWIFYLLGKEFGKRRIGLLMASAGAICKPLLMFVLSYMRYPTLPMAVALVLLFSVRLFKKPTNSHFLGWSLSLSLCYYTYTAFRPLGPYFLLVVLLWVFWREREKRGQGWNWTLGGGLLGLLAFLFIYLHRFYFNEQSAFRRLVEFLLEKARLEYFWGAALAAVGVRVWFEGRREGKDREILRWSWAALVFAALVTPALMPLELRTRLANSDNLMGGVHSVFGVAGVFLRRISLTLNTLFYTGGDRYDINLEGDPFFDVASLAFIFPGLAYAALTPKPRTLFILLTAALGLAPHILTDPAGSRLIDCVVPLLLLGALGVNRILEGAFSSPQAGWKWVAAFIVAGWLGSGAYVNFEKIYAHFELMPRTGPVLAQQAMEEERQNRVYLGTYEGYPSQSALNEENDTYILSLSSNIIYLEPGEKAPDTVILFQNDRLPKPDILAEIKAQLPKAQISQHPMRPLQAWDSSTFTRVFIPGEALDENKSKLIHIERIPSTAWTRKIYKEGYRIGCGLIINEDRAPSPTAPFLPNLPTAQEMGVCTGRIEGHWEADQDGSYGFSVETGQSLDLWIGDKLVFHVRPGSKKAYRTTEHFQKGSYAVRMMVLCPISQGVPAVSVSAPGSGEKKPL